MKFGLTGFACLVVLAIIPPAAAQEKPIEEQILDIITSSNGTVRKWMRAPKLVVIYDQESYETEINALVEEINTRVIGFPGFREVEYFDIGGNPDHLFGNVLFSMGDSTESGLLAIIINNIVHIRQGEIFLFIAETKVGTLLGEAVATNDAMHLRRRFAENTADTTCYVNVGSLNDQITSGWIFINSNDDDALIRHCIYEELTQSLGALYDTEWSTVFTYNDRSGPISDTAADFQLLSAIYDSSILPGSMPEGVLDAYNSLEEN